MPGPADRHAWMATPGCPAVKAKIIRSRMKMFLEHGALIFVHIPRTGGTSIEAAFGLHSSVHATAAQMRACDPSAWAASQSFAVLRDPLDRVVSMYAYARQGGNGAPWETLGQYAAGLSLEEYVARLPNVVDPFVRLPQSHWIEMPSSSAEAPVPLLDRDAEAPSHRSRAVGVDQAVGVDHLLCFEQLAAHFDQLHLGVRLGGTHARASARAAMDVVSAATRARVYRLFAHDHELWSRHCNRSRAAASAAVRMSSGTGGGGAMPTAMHKCTTATPCHGAFPHTFHLLWPTRELTFPGRPAEEARIRRVVDRLRGLHPSWQIRVWTDADCEQLMIQSMPARLAAWRLLAPRLKQFDAIRPLILHEHGGIYLDVDVECSRPIDALLTRPSTALLLRADDPACFHRVTPEYRAHSLSTRRPIASGNHIMGSIARHPLWLYYLDAIYSHEPPDTTVVGHTGNGGLERAVSAFLADHPEQRPSLRLLTCAEFQNTGQSGACARGAQCANLTCRHTNSLSPVETQPGGDDNQQGQLLRASTHLASNAAPLAPAAAKAATPSVPTLFVHFSGCGGTSVVELARQLTWLFTVPPPARSSGHNANVGCAHGDQTNTHGLIRNLKGERCPCSELRTLARTNAWSFFGNENPVIAPLGCVGMQYWTVMRHPIDRLLSRLFKPAKTAGTWHFVHPSWVQHALNTTTLFTTTRFMSASSYSDRINHHEFTGTVRHVPSMRSCCMRAAAGRERAEGPPPPPRSLSLIGARERSERDGTTASLFLQHQSLSGPLPLRARAAPCGVGPRDAWVSGKTATPWGEGGGDTWVLEHGGEWTSRALPPCSRRR